MRRNAAAVATAAIVAVLLVVSGVAIVRERNLAIASEARAVREADTARTEAAKASEVARFLTELFRESDPARARGASVTARELLARGADCVSTELASQDGVRATLMDTIGVVYRLLGQLDQSEALTSEALEIRRGTLGDEHPDVATSLDNLGQIARERSTYELAEQYHRQSLEVRRRLLAPGHPDVAQSLHNLALTLKERGRYDEAEALGRRRSPVGAPSWGPTIRTRSARQVSWPTSSSRAAGRLRPSSCIARCSRPGGGCCCQAIRCLPPASTTSPMPWRSRAGSPRPSRSSARRWRCGARSTIPTIRRCRPASTTLPLRCTISAGWTRPNRSIVKRWPSIAARAARSTWMWPSISTTGVAAEHRVELKEAGRLFQESLEIRLALQGERHPSVAHGAEQHRAVAIQT